MRNMLNLDEIMGKADDVVSVPVCGRRVTLKVAPFICGDNKAGVGKVLEEAAEVFGAWQECKHDIGTESELGCTCCDKCSITCPHRNKLAYEMADLITAICNLAYRNGIGEVELQNAICAVERSNKKKGRY